MRPYDHNCMIPTYKSPNFERDKHAYVYYDLETMAVTKDYSSGDHHVVNLCVTNTVCDKCEHDESDDCVCESCGNRENEFENKPGNEHAALDAFLDYIFDLEKKMNVTCIAHNGSGYDTILIARRLFKTQSQIKPFMVANGSKILLLAFSKIKFIDSLNFALCGLSKLPSMFQLDVESKGYFPHKFNKPENQTYQGAYPDASYYEPDRMMANERKTFFEWYEKVKNDHFDLKAELSKYCKIDVKILRKFCIKLDKEMFEETTVKIFREAITLAAFVNKVYRKLFYKNNISMIPKNGFRLADKQSKIAIQYLLYLEKFIYKQEIQSSFRGREKTINCGTTQYKVDGYIEQQTSTGLRKIIHEFQGCYFHAHSCLNSSLSADTVEMETRDIKALRRERTKKKIALLRASGFEVIEMWECDFKKIVKERADVRELLDQLRIEKLDPKDAFYGGSTDCPAIYYKCREGEIIRYLDFCSLYPTVNRFDKNVINTPLHIYVGVECEAVDLKKTEGLIRVRVVPPTDLFHPVLPVKLNNKLMFPLCFKCAEKNQQTTCEHSDLERSFKGTFVISELNRAIEYGYKVQEIDEIWEYETVTGLFADFVKHFQTMKLYASGYPQGYDENTIDDFIVAYKIRENVELDKTKFVYSGAKRTFAKRILNSLWGKFGESKKPTSRVITDSAAFIKVVTNSQFDIRGFHIINSDTILVNYLDLDAPPLPTANVVVAAFTTAAARLRLHEALIKADKRVKYFDTGKSSFQYKKCKILNLSLSSFRLCFLCTKNKRARYSNNRSPSRGFD